MAIITISRGTFSGGQKLAECVAEKNGYRCISREFLVRAATRYGMQLEELSKALMEPPGFLERLTAERMRYLFCTRAALIRAVRDDNVVYHGLAGHFLLAGVPNVLRIRVIASMEFRIKAAMERNSLPRREAIEHIKKMDEKRVKWTKFLYHVDWHDPSLYDLTINLDHISLESACEIISHCVTLDEFAQHSDWRTTIDDLVLSTEVRAIVATSKDVADLGLEVEARDGIITLKGTVGSSQDADKIREIVVAIPGVKDINSKMQVKSP